MQPQQSRPMPSHQHGPTGRFYDERTSPSMQGYNSPGSYSPGRMSPSGGPGAKKSRLLPQLPPGREPMGKTFKHSKHRGTGRVTSLDLRPLTQHWRNITLFYILHGGCLKISELKFMLFPLKVSLNLINQSALLYRMLTFSPFKTLLSTLKCVKFFIL